MTIQELRQKPTGVLETRSFTFKHKKEEYETSYCLVKREDGKYFIGFSDNGSYCSESVCENDMLKLLNNVKLSNQWAWEIYMQSPHLSSWMD